MYNQPEVALEKYEISLNQMIKGRGIYLCNTDVGNVGLKPFKGSMERAMELHNMLVALGDNGFDTEQILLTEEGSAAAEDDAELRYIVKTVYEGRECSPMDYGELKGAMRTLAEFHKASPAQAVPEYMMESLDGLRRNYERHNRELVKVKNYIKSKKKKNEFEMKYVKVYTHYYEEASQVVEIMNRVDSQQYPLGWCHRDYTYHNVIHLVDGFKLVNLENAIYGVQVQDIATFLRKIMEKNSWSILLGDNLLEEYQRIRTINRQEYILLSCLMNYPEKFWKLGNHYYNSKKSWGALRHQQKLEDIVGQEENRRAFLEKLFSINI